MRSFSAVLAIAMAIQPLLVQRAWAEPAEPRVQVNVLRLSARSVLEEIAADAGRQIQFVEFEDFDVTDWSFDGPFSEAVDDLSRKYGFFYTFDGLRFIASNRNLGVDVVLIEQGRLARVGAAVDAVFPNVSGSAMSVSAGGEFVVLRGSKGYIDTVKQVAEVLTKPDEIRFIRYGIRSIDRPPGN